MIDPTPRAPDVAHADAGAPAGPGDPPSIDPGIEPTIPAARIAVAIGPRTRTFPVYAPASLFAERRLRRLDDGLAFNLGAQSARLPQFGNRSSSKQAQHNFPLALKGPGRLRLSIRADGGSYSQDCLLCLQIFDAGGTFITQTLEPLSQPFGEHDLRLPAHAALGCFSLQLAGAGVARDLDVAIARRGLLSRAHVSFRAGLSTPDDLATIMNDPASGDDGLRDVLAREGPLAVATIAHWYRAGRYNEILDLLDRARALSARPTDRALAHLRYYAARTLAKLNATRSAAEVFDELWAMTEWRTLLDDDTRRAALTLRSNVRFRNGEITEGLAALEDAKRNDPSHWEAHYLLGSRLDDSDPELKDASFRAAEARRSHPHPKLAAASIENDLARGRREDALAKATSAAAAIEGPHDIWLSLANIHLDRGDGAQWRRCVGRFFEQYGLAAPRLDPAAEASGSPFSILPDEPSSRAPRMQAPGARVAVVMTCFNSERTVEFAMRSVLAQSHADLALAVVDDCSSDGTVAIAQRIAASDPRVTVLSTDANSGTYWAKNIALSRIDADYYTFHDSDDWMHPDRIARHLAAMEATRAACTTSMWFRMDARGTALLRHSGGYRHGNPASIFIRRQVLETIGYFDSVRTGADTEYVWRVRARFGPGAAPELTEPLGVGLHHDRSLTRSGATAFDRHRYSQVRLDYWESWVRWHRETSSGDPGDFYVPFPQTHRKYWAPPSIAPEAGRDEVPASDDGAPKTGS